MILVRDVFQAKYGKSDELAALFKEAQKEWARIGYGHRVLTDASGPFFTVVTETEVESLADWERRAADIYSLPEFGDWFRRMEPLVESGQREFFNIAA